MLWDKLNVSRVQKIVNKQHLFELLDNLPASKKGHVNQELRDYPAMSRTARNNFQILCYQNWFVTNAHLGKILKTSTSHTCNANEDSEHEADQEQHEDQDKMPFGQGVEPHGGQSVGVGHSLQLTHGT